MFDKKNLDEKIDGIHECEKCRDIQIKKFSPIVDYDDFDNLCDDFKRCECGKRPIDVVMAHILKIMVEKKHLINLNLIIERNILKTIIKQIYQKNRFYI